MSEARLQSLKTGLIFLEGLCREDLKLGKAALAEKRFHALLLAVRGWKFVARGATDDLDELDATVWAAANELYPLRKQQRGRREGSQMPHTIPVDLQVRGAIDAGTSLGRAIRKLPETKQKAALAREQRRRRREKANKAFET